MKLIFNNQAELVIDYFSVADGMMNVKSQWSPYEYIKNLFEDSLATSLITYENSDEQNLYENYTQFEEIREDKNGVVTVIMSQNGCGTIDKINTLSSEIEQTKNDIEIIKSITSNINPDIIEAMTFIVEKNIQTLSDSESIKVKSLYEKWNKLVETNFTAKASGYKFMHEDILYKTIKENQEFQSQCVPGDGTESIFTRIDESHTGTKDDPIPYHTNMEVFKEKYYTEDEILYKCTRDSGQALHNKASELIGHYFEVVSGK